MIELEKALRNSPVILDKVQNLDYAKLLYGSLTNMFYARIESFDPLTNKDELGGMSFRYAGGVVAELRDNGETYLDFYCSSAEGHVDPQVREDLKELGWMLVEYDDDGY